MNFSDGSSATHAHPCPDSAAEPLSLLCWSLDLMLVIAFSPMHSRSKGEVWQSFEADESPVAYSGSFPAVDPRNGGLVGPSHAASLPSASYASF